MARHAHHLPRRQRRRRAAVDRDNSRLKGHKGQLFDGGIRTPLVVCWPARRAARAPRVVATPVISLDLAPTILEAAGVVAPRARTAHGAEVAFDGKSLLPLLTAPAGAAHHEALHWLDGHPDWRDANLPWVGTRAWAIRRGRFKIYGGSEGVKLYDLDADRMETTDVSEQFPDDFEEMVALHTAWRDDVYETYRSSERTAGNFSEARRRALAVPRGSNEACPQTKAFRSKYAQRHQQWNRASRMILHHVDDCAQCGLNWCYLPAVTARDQTELRKQVAAATIGAPLSQLGCANVSLRDWVWAWRKSALRRSSRSNTSALSRTTSTRARGALATGAAMAIGTRSPSRASPVYGCAQTSSREARPYRI